MTNCLIDFLKEQDVEFIEGFNTKDISSIGIGGVAELAVFGLRFFYRLLVSCKIHFYDTAVIHAVHLLV